MKVISTSPSLSFASTVAFHEYFPNSQYFVSSTGGGGASSAYERVGRFFRTSGANKNLTTVAITVLRFYTFKFIKVEMGYSSFNSENEAHEALTKFKENEKTILE
jgi:hypothetical protein